VSGVVVPVGFVCTFFEEWDLDSYVYQTYHLTFFFSNFGCDLGQGAGVSLTSGAWSMFSVPGPAGNIDFNDQASSFTCSPV
jgi:hypothetical protein